MMRGALFNSLAGAVNTFLGVVNIGHAAEWVVALNFSGAVFCSVMAIVVAIGESGR